LFADVSPHEQGDEGTDRSADELCGHLIQALVDRIRIESAVKLLVDDMRHVATITSSP